MGEQQNGDRQPNTFLPGTVWFPWDQLSENLKPFPHFTLILLIFYNKFRNYVYNWICLFINELRQGDKFHYTVRLKEKSLYFFLKSPQLNLRRYFQDIFILMDSLGLFFQIRPNNLKIFHARASRIFFLWKGAKFSLDRIW